jgi:hypothetical protein
MGMLVLPVFCYANPAPYDYRFGLPFDTSSATTSPSSLGNLVNGSTSYVYDTSSAVGGGYKNTRPTNGWGYLTGTDNTDFSGPFSFSGWVKPNVNLGSNNFAWSIFGKYGSSGAKEYSVRYGHNTGTDYYLEFQYSDNGTNVSNCYAPFTGVMASTTWNHIAMTYDTGTIQFYVNNVALPTCVGYPTVINNVSTSTVRFGNININGTYQNSFGGQMDEFAFYDRVLSTSEITYWYNSGTPMSINYLQPPPGELDEAMNFFDSYFVDTSTSTQADMILHNDLVFGIAILVFLAGLPIFSKIINLSPL